MSLNVKQISTSEECIPKPLNVDPKRVKQILGKTGVRIALTSSTIRVLMLTSRLSSASRSTHENHAH